MKKLVAASFFLLVAISCYGQSIPLPADVNQIPDSAGQICLMYGNCDNQEGTDFDHVICPGGGYEQLNGACTSTAVYDFSKDTDNIIANTLGVTNQNALTIKVTVSAPEPTPCEAAGADCNAIDNAVQNTVENILNNPGPSLMLALGDFDFGPLDYAAPEGRAAINEINKSVSQLIRDAVVNERRIRPDFSPTTKQILSGLMTDEVKYAQSNLRELNSLKFSLDMSKGWNDPSVKPAIDMIMVRLKENEWALQTFNQLSQVPK